MPTLAAIGWKVLPRIDVGPLSISPHGLGIAVGFTLGGVLLARRAQRFYGVPPEHTWNALMWAVVGVIVGSRLFYVVGHLDDYAGRPLDIFKVWEGGVVFYGGAIGGVVAALPYLRKQGIAAWPMLDAAAPGFPLGLIFGRIGDLIIGDHLGEPTSFFLGFRYQGCIGAACENFVPAIRAGEPPVTGMVYHQTALYDFISVALLFPLVMVIGRKPRPKGWLMMFVVTWYAAARFVTDFARTTDTYVGLHGTQWVSIALMLFGGIMLVRMRSMPEPDLSLTGDDEEEDEEEHPPPRLPNEDADEQVPPSPLQDGGEDRVD